MKEQLPLVDLSCFFFLFSLDANELDLSGKWADSLQSLGIFGVFGEMEGWTLILLKMFCLDLFMLSFSAGPLMFFRLYQVQNPALFFLVQSL